MQANSKLAGTIDEYIEQFPANVQATLQKLRATIKKTAPKAEEVISYQMPAFKYYGMQIDVQPVCCFHHQCCLNARWRELHLRRIGRYRF